jgi:hypothetical protein
MSKQLIPVDEILFVFEAWTLMMQSGLSSQLEPGDEVFLLNSSEEKIGKAMLNKVLPSKNLDVSPIEITLIEMPAKVKEVKFVMKLD